MLTLQQSPRQRSGTTKVRTGCDTCKVRRVKCDEGKPQCQRCLKAKRKCEGYLREKSSATVSHQHINQVGIPIDWRPNLDLSEKRALRVFVDMVAPTLATQFCVDMYSRHLLLVSTYEDGIRHAIVALSSVYEQFSGAYHVRNGIPEFALEHYGQALRSITSMQASDAPKSVEVALLACLVFADLEALQGHDSSAFAHVRSGLRLLEIDTSFSRQPVEAYIPRLVLRQAFVRTMTQCLEIGLLSSSQCPRNLTPYRAFRPLEFQSVNQAVVSLSAKTNVLLLFVQDRSLAVNAEASQQQAFATRDRKEQIVNSFLEWCEAFHRMPMHPGERMENFVICELYKIYISIILRVDLHQGQVAFDHFEEEFQKIVVLASMMLAHVSTIMPGTVAPQYQPEVLLVHNPGAAPPSAEVRQAADFVNMQAELTPICSELPSLPPSRIQRPEKSILPNPGSYYKPTYMSLGLGIIGPLVSVCTRCRNTKTRLQALSLLEMCNRREGLCDSSLAAKHCRIAIDSELAAVSDSATHGSLSAIPEHVRVQEIGAAFTSQSHRDALCIK